MIDRGDERVWLQDALTDEGRELLILYGRRRVGKTTLVTAVLDDLDVPSVYYLCDQRGIGANARALAQRCASALDHVPPAVDGFADVFTEHSRRTPRHSRRG